MWIQKSIVTTQKLISCTANSVDIVYLHNLHWFWCFLSNEMTFFRQRFKVRKLHFLDFGYNQSSFLFGKSKHSENYYTYRVGSWLQIDMRTKWLRLAFKKLWLKIVGAFFWHILYKQNIHFAFFEEKANVPFDPSRRVDDVRILLKLKP